MKDIDRQMSYLYRQCLLIGLLVVVVLSDLLSFPDDPCSYKELNEATHMIARTSCIRVPIVRLDEIGQLLHLAMSVALQRIAMRQRLQIR